MVLPRGLMSLSVGASADRLNTTKRWDWIDQVSLAYGITDKLEIANLTLSYAFLDDAPAPERAPEAQRARLSVALRGGVDGFGYSSLQGFVIIPKISLEIGKHLGDRIYVWGGTGLNASWVASPQPRVSLYTAALWPNAGRQSRVHLAAGGLLQLVDHVALAASVGVDELHACTVPTCAWAARGVWASLGPSIRPRHWLNVAVSGYMGARTRPLASLIPEPTPETAVSPPRNVSWVGVVGAVALLW
ncbi:MAG TPA: hypothetical protein VFH73_21470 [Polyangia bacterium]|jgi:hypothetical protein|nr:hypothetical protein [Polyangia bacterium]